MPRRCARAPCRPSCRELVARLWRGRLSSGDAALLVDPGAVGVDERLQRRARRGAVRQRREVLHRDGRLPRSSWVITRRTSRAGSQVVRTRVTGSASTRDCRPRRRGRPRTRRARGTGGRRRGRPSRSVSRRWFGARPRTPPGTALQLDLEHELPRRCAALLADLARFTRNSDSARVPGRGPASSVAPSASFTAQPDAGIHPGVRNRRPCARELRHIERHATSRGAALPAPRRQTVGFAVLSTRRRLALL